MKGLIPGGMALVIGGSFTGKLVTTTCPVGPGEMFTTPNGNRYKCAVDSNPKGWLIEHPSIYAGSPSDGEYSWSLISSDHLLPIDDSDPDVRVNSIGRGILTPLIYW